MQLPGHIINKDGVLGVVETTGSVMLNQPDKVLMGTAPDGTVVEVERTPQPQIEVQTVTVAWEDGTSSTLTDWIDSWVVLGAVQELPSIKDPANPPPGAFGELPEQQKAVEAVTKNVAAYAQELRDAAPFAAAHAEAQMADLTIVEDGQLSVAE